MHSGACEADGGKRPGAIDMAVLAAAHDYWFSDGPNGPITGEARVRVDLPG